MKKTFAEWEMETGMLAYDPSPYGSKTYTKQEFDAAVQKDVLKFHGVDLKVRKKFLKDNGYELTRENLMANLSARQPVEE